MPDEIEPRIVPKRVPRASSEIDRSDKGEPSIRVRPTFDTELRHVGGLANLRVSDLVFAHDESLPVGGFAALEGQTTRVEEAAGFELWPDGDSPTTARSTAAGSPYGFDASTITMRPAAIAQRLMQGATPAVQRAIALASVTPAPTGSMPIELSAVPDDRRQVDNTAPPQWTRRSSAFLEQDFSAREQRCLAEAIYFEARSEPWEGQAAVAQVVLNRIASGLYPPTICGVVYQNGQRLNACQFSFACQGKSLRITEPDAWQNAVRVAAEVTAGRIHLPDVGAATHYHADYVRPRWARRLEKMDAIGHHIFYKLPLGRS